VTGNKVEVSSIVAVRVGLNKFVSGGRSGIFSAKEYIVKYIEMSLSAFIKNIIS